MTRYPGGLLVVSHDRAFLNALCTGILELRNNTLNRYTGNYSAFETMRADQIAAQQAAMSKQQDKIAHLQKFVDRFGTKASMASRATPPGRSRRDTSRT